MKKSIILIIFSCFLLNAYNQNNINKPSTITQTVDIGFTKRFTASDLQIKRLTAFLDGDSVLFTVIYTSKTDRSLYMFNPSWGSSLSYRYKNLLKKNDTIASFHVDKQDFLGIEDISINFYNQQHDNGSNFIFLITYDTAVKQLLGLSKKRFLTRILSLPTNLFVIIALCFLVPLLLFIGNKTDIYISNLEKRITNKWLVFNVKVLIFSVIIISIILLITKNLEREFSSNLYLSLLIISFVPINLVYFVEDKLLKKRKSFWLWQYLTLLFFVGTLFYTYKLCNSATSKAISHHGIAIEFVVLCGFLVGFIRLINNYLSYQKILSLKEKELEISRLNELKIRSDLNALQSKINPHFLYNALNSIAELCWKDAAKTERMALSLSKLFRYSINKEESDFNTLKNEIEIVGLYLSIEKERFGDNLNYQFEYSSDIENILIPKFILQPLIENAIKHGIAKNSNGGDVKLTIKKIENHLEIKIYDNGPDFPVDLISGYGLKSIYDKLDILYPKRYSIELYNGIEKNITLILKDGIKIDHN